MRAMFRGACGAQGFQHALRTGRALMQSGTNYSTQSGPALVQADINSAAAAPKPGHKRLNLCNAVNDALSVALETNERSVGFIKEAISLGWSTRPSDVEPASICASKPWTDR